MRQRGEVRVLKTPGNGKRQEKKARMAQKGIDLGKQALGR